MIDGFSLQFYSDHYRSAWQTEIGWQIGYLVGSDVRWDWRIAGYPDEKAEATMAQIEEQIGVTQIEGFTLFMHTGKGWQMSVRRAGEPGWNINIIPDEQAQAILSMLQASGHPDGPLTVSTQAAAPLRSAMAAAERARDELTASILARIA